MDSEQDLSQQLLTTAFVRSWIGRARAADKFDPDPARRAAAWAQWAFRALSPMTGNSDRPYVALTLPGRFYDPRGTGPVVRPHLEVPGWLFDKPMPDFPDRLAQMGNGLAFPWWIVPEVMAVKRVLFNTGRGSAGEAIDLLNEHRAALADALTPVSATAGGKWSQVESLQVESPDGLSEVATAPFEPDEVAAYLPALADLNVRLEFDKKLRESNRAWASRRVGVWELHGEADGRRFSLGVITPRLTRSSLFSDPLFHPSTEAPAALLVRGLLLRRLLRTQLGESVVGPVKTVEVGRPAPAGPRLRAVVARVGEKLPEASVPGAVHFLQTYPAPAAAWAALEGWASARSATGDGRRALLTVTESGFTAAHQAALRALRRAEEPDRDDINVVLPLAWDSRSRVVRVTFSKPPADEDPDTA